MDLSASRLARSLAILATYGAAIIVAAAVYAALWTPGTLGLSSGRGAQGLQVVTWVAPNGPAWSAGVMPGAAIVGCLPWHSAKAAVVLRQGATHIVLGLDATRVDPLDLLVSAVGLAVLLFGGLILAKGRGQDRRAAWAFWRMSLLIGLALGAVPAGFHGVPWAVALCFVTLTLFGPALLALTFVFPGPTAPPRYRAPLWLPAYIPLLLYPFCWWRPVPLFSPVSAAGDALLAAYIMVACARLTWVWLRPGSTPQREQLQWLVLGLILGFLPLALFNLLPNLLLEHDLLPPQVSILALALLPLCVGAAIVRAEVFGITSLLRRRTLRILVVVILLAGVAIVAGLFSTLAVRRWGWPTPLTAGTASVLTALAALSARPWLTRRAERALFRDVYDPADVVLRVSADLSHALPHTLGPLVVTHLSAIFDLDFALLLTANDYYLHAHARSPVSIATLEHITQHAQALLAAPSLVQPIMDTVAGTPLLVLPIGDSQRMQAVICCGPKHSGEGYTRQDRSLLYALGHDLMARFAFQAQLDEQTALLCALQEARALTTPDIAIPVGEPLSRGELRVLIHLAQGLSYKDTAERLEREPETIEKHAKNIRRKLGVGAITDAVAIARQRGLLPPEVD